MTMWSSVPSHILITGLLPGLLLSVSAATADTVVYTTGEDDRSQSTANGTIIDYTGRQLVLQRQSGAEQVVPTLRVVRVDFARSPMHREADRLFQVGDYDQAIRGYVQAASEESREWVQRMIVAQMVRAYTMLGQIDRAGRAFLQLVGSDPNTQYYAAIPLSWRSDATSSQWEGQAREWIAADDDPLARLMGASWLLSGPGRADAIRTLQALAGERDSRIVFLAQAQLWRTRIVTADRAEVERWAAVVERMPSDLRGGPYFVLGQAFSALGEHQQAALAFLRLPILYRAQHGLAAWALLSAGRELERIDQVEQAVTLYRELVRDYLEHPAAAEGRALLERTTGA